MRRLHPLKLCLHHNPPKGIGSRSLLFGNRSDRGDLTWKTISAFVLFATFLTSIGGWLTATEIFPLQQGIQDSDAERNFFQIWLGLAIVIPAIAYSVRVYLKPAPIIARVSTMTALLRLVLAIFD
ncbi:hypothetical protein [Chamaesiphon minutus]|uniref:Uncharacterized protein n=1 Tax=Chamaesiphon minutus (strain ATCC 27169 / PCC 6605) TaxID=1173020 RepID=K9UE52_CHAP6|nr:hypothetical protein [Chamaesiphon minutus]AFY92484.1 hypothetical protein Cha6605_1283 [Chamaesiphon minutus PCC 6605]